jgi:hypothetical protein
MRTRKSGESNRAKIARIAKRWADQVAVALTGPRFDFNAALTCAQNVTDLVSTQVTQQRTTRQAAGAAADTSQSAARPPTTSTDLPALLSQKGPMTKKEIVAATDRDYRFINLRVAEAVKSGAIIQEGQGPTATYRVAAGRVAA